MMMCHIRAAVPVESLSLPPCGLMMKQDMRLLSCCCPLTLLLLLYRGLSPIAGISVGPGDSVTHKAYTSSMSRTDPIPSFDLSLARSLVYVYACGLSSFIVPSRPLTDTSLRPRITPHPFPPYTTPMRMADARAPPPFPAAGAHPYYGIIRISSVRPLRSAPPLVRRRWRIRCPPPRRCWCRSCRCCASRPRPPWAR